MNPSIEFKSDETIETTVQDINYIPAYKQAEEQRRANELQRIANENTRIAYYNEIQNKVNNGDFKGEKGDKGEQGIQGVAGYTPIKGTDYWTTEDITTIENHCNSYINEQLGTINEQLASLTEVAK